MAKLGAVSLVSEAAATGRPRPAPAVKPAALLHEETREEPYRPALVERLERALREGRYHPDARAIADAIVTRIDALTDA